jgi:hypothetical protein
MRIEVLQICLQVWIECIIIGKFVQLLGNGIFKIKMVIGQSFLKLLLTNHYGFGMFFWLPNSNNDINVLDQSPLVANLFQGLVVDMEFIVNGKTHPNYYGLVNGNYLRSKIFVQTIHEPQGEK